MDKPVITMITDFTDCMMPTDDSVGRGSTVAMDKPVVGRWRGCLPRLDGGASRNL